jgi:predicted dienelactone hydrolase
MGTPVAVPGWTETEPGWPWVVAPGTGTVVVVVVPGMGTVAVEPVPVVVIATGMVPVVEGVVVIATGLLTEVVV